MVLAVLTMAMVVVMVTLKNLFFFLNVKQSRRRLFQRQRLLLLPPILPVMMETHLNFHKRPIDLRHSIDLPDSLFVKGSIWTSHLILNLRKENYRTDSSYVQKQIG